ncbi:MAG: VCBS repeat-containing protein, partial [Bacteroidota bacterium]
MSKLLPGLFLCCYVFAQAQIVAPISLFEPVGNSEYNIAIDVDNDGELEVVCATSERLFWVERMEDGYFSKHNVISPIGLTYRSLTAADLNEDGFDDLAYASHDGGFGIHLNQGDGTFSEAIQIYDPGSPVIELFMADLNGDGHLDAMTGTSSEARWLEGNGNGTFDTPRLLSNQTTVSSIYAADLDQDEDLDIVVAAINGDLLSWHENLGNNQFGPNQVINDYHDGPRTVVAEDVDGDGLADLVVGNRQEPSETGAGLVWYRNTGTSSFELMDTLMAAGWHDYLHLADLDIDGDLDVISCHSNDDMAWLANDGSGNFGPPQELARNSRHVRFVETPDLNNDGFPDILYGLNDNSNLRNTVLWRESTGAAQFKPFDFVTVGGGDFGKPVVADMDQDGHLDYVIGSGDAEALVWFRKEGDGFSPARLIARRSNYDPLSIAVADLNGDGFPDIMAGSIQDGFSSDVDFCVYYNNNGNGTFTAGEPFQTFYSWQRKMELIDMDYDGDLDFFYVNAGPGTGSPQALVGWVRNDGDTWSEPIIILDELTNLLDVLITDFDADGKRELILCKTDAP